MFQCYSYIVFFLHNMMTTFWMQEKLLSLKTGSTPVNMKDYRNMLDRMELKISSSPKTNITAGAA